MTDTAELLRRHRERERRRQAEKPVPAPALGLDSDETRFSRGSEDFHFFHVFDFHIEKSDPFYGARGSVEIDHCTQVGRAVRVEIPLACFEHKDLEMVREEIVEALRQRRADNADDGGDRAYEGWKDKQIQRAWDAMADDL